MRKIASTLAVFGLALALAGCGGSSGCGSLSSGGGNGNAGGCGTSTTTPPPATSNVSSLAVSSSVATIPGDGSSSATITVLAKDKNNNALSGVAVTLATSAGTLTGAAAMTDANGLITASLSATGVAPGTSITLTATSGAVTGQGTIMVATVQQTVTLQTSSPQIPSDNTSPATLTALVKDAKNNVVPGVVVQFQASSGGLVVNPPANGTTPGLTDSRGTATATLSIGGDPSIRVITVTASLGSSTTTVNVNVVGTTASLSGPSSLVLGSSGTYTVSLNDAGKNGLPSQAVKVTSSAGNTLSASSLTTDVSGHATFTVTASKAGADSLSVSALGASATQALTVSSQQFQFSVPTAGANINISADPCTPNTPVTVNWQNNGAAVPNAAVSFSTTRGTLSADTATTNAQGDAQVMICASSAGPATISASGTNVSATLAVNFVSTTPATIDLQATPSTVAITGQSTLTAVVRDSGGNLVANQAVDFTLTDVTGGSLSVASATTSGSGVAQTVYTASNTASATNGVSVTAQIHNNTAINKTAKLTVNGAPLHISFGTGNKLLENPTQTAFIMNWFVSVLDSTGHPVPNTQVTLSIHSSSFPLYAYAKGSYTVCKGAWVPYDGHNPGDCAATTPVQPNPATACYNEDMNLDGQLDAGDNDLNQNGKLEPGDIALASPGVVTTGTDGTSTFQVIYPEDHANWVQVTLTAAATVSGTESSNSTTFTLPMLAAYMTNTASSPPGFISPYGTGACSDKN